MLRNIVVAADGSDHAKQAVKLASEISVATGARLTILHVLKGENSANIPDDLKEFARVEHVEANDTDWLQGVADKILDDAKDMAKAAGAKDVETRTEVGDPATQIIGYCRANSADLVIVGRRGLGDLQSLVLGSVSHKTSQRAPCACMTVPGAKPDS